MKLNQSISNDKLSSFVAGQLNTFFPDGNVISEQDISQLLPITMERVYSCFSRIKIKYYRGGSEVLFNHLHSDQYCAFLYLLGNTAFIKGNTNLATKSFLLNKSLHGVDLYYSVQLPEVFLLVHPLGSIIGNAKYDNFLTIYQNCTIGSVIKNGKYVYPVIGEHVTLFAKSTLIGDVKLGSNTVVGANAFVINTHIPDNSIITGIFPNLKISINKNNESPFFL